LEAFIVDFSAVPSRVAGLEGARVASTAPPAIALGLPHSRRWLEELPDQFRRQFVDARWWRVRAASERDRLLPRSPIQSIGLTPHLSFGSDVVVAERGLVVPATVDDRLSSCGKADAWKRRPARSA